jgi:YesN/AraC family two-component response regulator
MPGGTGFDLVQIVNTHRNRPHVLFMSGYSVNEMARRGIESGQYPFLPKPFTPTQLALVVSDILGGGESS